MSAAVSLASLDWGSIAPEDWFYCADLPIHWPSADAAPISGVVLVVSPRLAPGWVDSYVPLPGPRPASRVRSTSCGGTSLGWWEGPCCDHCRPGVERAALAVHEKRVRQTYAAALKLTPRERASLWLAEISGRGETRTEQDATPYERPSKAKAKDETPRDRVTLTKDEQHQAADYLDSYPVRRALDREDWTAEVWLELLAPPVNVTEPCSLRQRIDRAIWRAEKNLRNS